MPPDSPRSLFRRSLGRPLLGLGLALLIGWLAFFDSHSLARRMQWHQERAALAAENARLEASIRTLEAELKAASSPEVIEKIAREQYGMRRPGETVYRVEEVGNQ